MESHINTFDKGMNKDYNILFQPEGTYRNMINCQLISQDGNNYTIKDCLGNVRVFFINIPFATFTPGGPPTITYQNAPMPIGFISFPDKLVIFSTNNESETGGYGEIGVIQYEPYGEGIQPINNTNSVGFNTYKGYVPLYHHKSLNFTKLRQIEGFAFAENDLVQRVYWTDNLNEPRVFDIGDPTFMNYLITGGLIVGQQYMVIEGAVTHNGFLYSPDVTTDTSAIAPNVFTASSTAFTDQSSSFVAAKVIKYVPYQLLSFTPSRALGNIKFNSYGTGSVYCGAKIYFYRLSNPANGVVTSWSYGSSPINVETTNSVTAILNGNYFNFSGGGTTNTLLNSTKSVKITIDNVDTNYTNIEVAVAEFDQILDTPRLISIISNDLISAVAVTTVPVGSVGTTVIIEHTGSVNIQTLTLDQITLFPASILTCKTMTTNKNYALIANTTERTEFTNFDKSTVTISQIDYPMPCHYADFGGSSSTVTCNNILSIDAINASTISNPANTDGIMPFTRWLVTVGTATYNAVTYTAGQVFIGAVGVFNWTNTSGTAQLRPCTYKNKFTTNAGVKVPDIIQLTERLNNTAYWNYKDPAIAHHVRGLWNKETYRYGILFYDLKGNPFYVRHLGDITLAAQDHVSMLSASVVNAAGQNAWYTHQTGVSLSGVTIPANIIDQISGFSIVRAERDARIMTQGLLMQVGANSGSAGAIIKPLCSADPRNNDSTFSTSKDQLFTFICPDRLANYPVNNYVPSSSLEPAVWFAPSAYGVNNSLMKSSYDGQASFESKYFTQLAPETTGPLNRSYKLLTVVDSSENSTLTNVGSAGYQYTNQTKFAIQAIQPSVTTCVEAGCATPPTSPNMDSSQAIGGRRSVMEIEIGNFYDYNNTSPSGILLTALATTGVYKPITNVTVPKTVFYGGTSLSALASTLYITTGHFQPINATVKSQSIDSNGNYTFNNVEIWGGDAYTCIIDYGHNLFDTTLSGAPAFASNSWGIKFPCQCNTNYDLRRGLTVANNRMYPNSNGVSYNPVRLESFEYNKGYSSDGNFIKYPALPVNFSSLGKFRYRVRFAGQKFPNELINSFRTFLTNDYKDTDGQMGEINNIVTKEGKTIVFQNAGVSTVPILERQLLGNGTGDPTTIGTGGVVDRFDPVDDYFGNQHQFGLTKTEYGFAWFDMRRKAFMVLDINSGIMEVSKIDGLNGFFNEKIIDNLGSLIQPTPLNSSNFLVTSDRPLIGVGITGVYDPKLKMTYLTFKWLNYVNDLKQYTNKGFTIGYYHLGKMFVSFYDWLPAISHNHNQFVISVNNPKNNNKYYGTGMPSTNFVVGDTVQIGSVEYICYLPITVTSYPGDTNSNPLTGTKYWEVLNKTNELYVHNQPKALNQIPAPDYQYNIFFNLVVNNEVQIIVNPKTENPFSVLHIEQKGANVNYTDIYIDAEGIAAADNNIQPTNRYYRWIYDRIASNLPLGLQGRLTGSILAVRMVKKNWTTNPSVLTNTGIKILQYLKSFYEQKR